MRAISKPAMTMPRSQARPHTASSPFPSRALLSARSVRLPLRSPLAVSPSRLPSCVRSPHRTRERTIPGVTCRVANDRRLFDAHEQLVLSAKDTWTGDCMRRDPTKRDSLRVLQHQLHKNCGLGHELIRAHLGAGPSPPVTAAPARKPAETPEQGGCRRIPHRQSRCHAGSVAPHH